MQKRRIVLLILITLSWKLFAEPKNIVYNNSFEYSNIDSLEISLTYENLKISRIYGDEIVIEIGSNNKKTIPLVSFEDNSDDSYGSLKIISPVQKTKIGSNCTVYVFLPQDFLPETISIALASGNLQSELLSANNALYIKNISGRTDISGCTTEYLNASSVSGNLTLQKITAGYFDISNTSGNIFLELEHSIEAKSRVTNISGRIQIYYKRDCFDTLAMTGESPFLDDSPELFISTVSGKVETVPFD